MPNSPDSSSAVPPPVRSGVEISRIQPDRFLLVDRATQRQMSFGPGERYLIELIDGERDLGAIREAYEKRFGLSIAPDHLEAFLESLRRAELLEGSELPEAQAAEARQRPGMPRPPRAATSTGATVGSLNHRFDLMALLFGWLLHPAWLILVAVLAMMGAAALMPNFDLYSDEFGSFLLDHPFTPVAALLVPLNFLFVTGPREVIKGTACRRFGGRVYAFRITRWLGVFPIVYCATGDSMLRMSKREAVTVGTAGLWYQLGLASIAAVLWSKTIPGSFPSSVWMVLVVPVLIAIALRLNPLAKFEGYLLFCMWLERPDLRNQALTEVDAWLHGRPSPRATSPRERFWLRFYGGAVLIFEKLFPFAVLCFALYVFTHRWKGVGLVITAVLALAIYKDNLRRILMDSPLQWLVRGSGAWYVRWPVRIAIVLLLVLIGHIPYAHQIGGEARIVPSAERSLRAQIASEILEVHVDDGQWVEADDLVVTLAARNERADLEKARAKLAGARAQLELLRVGPRQEQIAAAREQVKLQRIELNFAQSELSREERLAKGSISSATELERARRNRDSQLQELRIAEQNLAALETGSRTEEIQAAEAEVELLEALVRQQDELFALREIRSPIAGYVVTPNLAERAGQFAQHGDLIAVVQDTKKLRATISATQSAGLDIIEPGQEASIRLYALDGGLIEGTVVSTGSEAVDPRLITASGSVTPREADIKVTQQREKGDATIEVLVDFEPGERELKTGMTGYGKVEVQSDVLWRALWRPVKRFLFVDLWSWLP